MSILMHAQSSRWLAMTCCAIGMFPIAAHAGGLTVESCSPQPRIVSAPVSTSIVVTFDRPLDPASITANSFWAFGQTSGTAAGARSLSNGNQTLTLTPQRAFAPGERVMVILSHDIRAADGSFLRNAGYSWQFFTRTRQANLDFVQVQSFSTRTSPTSATRAYGGLAADLDNDGVADLAIINEVSADLRVFLNRDDNSGGFENMLSPPSALNFLASPSDTSDFNRDGQIDVCTGNGGSNSLSILLGDGDGTFAPQQLVTTVFNAYGIVAIDVDGDGDTDIVNPNFASNNLSLLRNNGSGVFGAPAFFGGNAVDGEYSIAAEDMNEDGILDIVVSGWSSHQVAVFLSNGDGTFTLKDVTSSGGETRKVVCGDVNGDGHADVAATNGFDDNASIIFGDGLGNLSNPVIYPTDPFTGPSRLADLDGDGDLDWIISSFNGSWQVYLNNGSGAFTFNQDFDPPQIASCTVPMDIDGDHDLDLVLIDEIADMVFVMKNNGTRRAGDVDHDGVVNIDDLIAVILSWGDCPSCAGCAADLNGSCVVDVDDLIAVILNWG